MTQELRSLYEITGDIKDINTVLVQRDRLEKAEKDNGDLQQKICDLRHKLETIKTHIQGDCV